MRTVSKRTPHHHRNTARHGRSGNIPLSNKTVRRIAKQTNFKWRIRHTQITVDNRASRIAFEEYHGAFSAIRWQRYVYTDSVPLNPHYKHNRHNEGFGWPKMTPYCLPANSADLRRLSTAMATSSDTVCAVPTSFTTRNQPTEVRMRVLAKMLPDIKAEFRHHEPWIFMQDGLQLTWPIRPKNSSNSTPLSSSDDSIGLVTAPTLIDLWPELQKFVTRSGVWQFP